MTITRYYKHILGLILVTAFLVRIIFINTSPPALNWDEVALGYNAYSLYQTGRDEFGKLLPLTLRSFDDYKSATYSYLTIPFIAFFGLNETSVRLVSAISGTIIVYLAYLFSEKFFKNKSISLLSAFFVSFSPWSIIFSRGAWETNLALTFYLAGVYFLLNNYPQGVLLLLLSAFTYHAEKILIFPTLILFIYVQKKFNRLYFLSFLVFLAPLSRFASSGIAKTWNGNPLDFLASIIARYLAYFSPVNIFVRGTPEPTQTIPGFAMFFSFTFFFWIIGLYQITKNHKRFLPLILLTLISPLAATLTWNWFYPARVLPLFFFYSLICALGAYILLKNKKLILFNLLLGFIAINQLFRLTTTLFLYFPYTQRGAWQYGMKQIITEIDKVDDNYDHIIFETNTAQPHIFTLFYLKYPPPKYQVFSKDIPKPRKNFDFGKFEFRPVLWSTDQKQGRVLLIGPDSSLPKNLVEKYPEVNYVSDVFDPEGNLLARIVGLK